MVPSEAVPPPLWGEPQGMTSGLAIPTKSGHARGKTHPLATHRSTLFWHMSFGVVQAAQKFGASRQEFSQSYVLLCFVVCEEYDGLSQQPGTACPAACAL